MHLRLRVLASGSSGNAALVTAHDGSTRHDLLIDMGLSPRRMRGLLRAEGTDLESLCGVLLTHGDVDHLHDGWAKAWPTLLAPPVIIRPSHGHVLPRAGLANAATRWIAEPLEIGPFRVAGFELPHDSEGSTGFRIECGSHAIGWITDLGRVVDGLDAFLVGVRVLALESNYDPPLQLASPRPAHLKRRIMDGHGHLSNQQALALVRRLESLGHLPEQLVLLHLSEQCNHPDLVRALWQREAPHLHGRMRVANRREPTEAIHCGAALALAG